MKITWQTQAINDLASVREYIAKDNRSASETLVATTLKIIDVQLSFSPKVGRRGRVSGTRELVIPQSPLIVVYRVRKTEIQILSVRHASRLWPVSFD